MSINLSTVLQLLLYITKPPVKLIKLPISQLTFFLFCSAAFILLACLHSLQEMMSDQTSNAVLNIHKIYLNSVFYRQPVLIPVLYAYAISLDRRCMNCILQYIWIWYSFLKLSLAVISACNIKTTHKCSLSMLLEQGAVEGMA